MYNPHYIIILSPLYPHHIPNYVNIHSMPIIFQSLRVKSAQQSRFHATFPGRIALRVVQKIPYFPSQKCARILLLIIPTKPGSLIPRMI